jgi:hypothetical protein
MKKAVKGKQINMDWKLGKKCPSSPVNSLQFRQESKATFRRIQEAAPAEVCNQTKVHKHVLSLAGLCVL